MERKIISVTGTKGKTTTVAVIADVLHGLGNNVLRVDTTGHFVNGSRKSTLDDSKATWGLVPSVSPGRYLYEFLLDPILVNGGAAVLECSLGCSAPSMGLGYRYHNIGMFLNVFEDHIGSSDRINSKADIAQAKDFVFSRITQNGDGYAVFNADDELVVDSLSVINGKDNIKLLPVGLQFNAFNVSEHVKKKGAYITTINNIVVLKTASNTVKLCDLKNVPWSFGGSFIPSVWNMMFVAAGVIAYNGGLIPAGLSNALESARLDIYSGRLTVLKAKNGAIIIADYAHEKESLSQIGRLARTLLSAGGKTIGVVRLAPDRTDELIKETGAVIGSSFDEVVVFDKIDGYWRKPRDRKMRFKEVIGHVSEVLEAGAKQTNQRVTRILREDEALRYAAEIAGPNDVVVAIVNDDIKCSLGFIQEAFNAEFA